MYLIFSGRRKRSGVFGLLSGPPDGVMYLFGGYCWWSVWVGAFDLWFVSVVASIEFFG